VFNNFDLRESLLMLPAILFGFSIHEFAHAYTARHFGDFTAEREGRITLNPFAHIDPLGLFLFFFAGYGWAKPVPVNLFNFQNRKKADLLVSLAGPCANALTMMAFAILLKLIFVFYPSLFYIPNYGKIIYEILVYFIWVNIIMAIFNLLPVPPLDGSRILFGFLPNKLYFGIMRYERFIAAGIMVLLFLGVLDKPLTFLISGALRGMGSLLGLKNLPW